MDRYRSKKIDEQSREQGREWNSNLPTCKLTCSHCEVKCGLIPDHDQTRCLCYDHAVNHHNLYGYSACDTAGCECEGVEPKKLVRAKK